jgi:hypothetical protein
MSIPGFTGEASLYKTSAHYRAMAGSPNDLVGSRGIFPQLSRGWGGPGACDQGCKALCELQFDLDEQDCWDKGKLYDCVEDAERKLEGCLDNCGCGPIIAREGWSATRRRTRSIRS